MLTDACFSCSAKASARGKAAAAKATGEAKQLRAAAKAAAEQSVESTLLMESALSSLGVSVDMFRYTLPQADPLNLTQDELENLQLDSLNVLLLMTDREGSQ